LADYYYRNAIVDEGFKVIETFNDPEINGLTLRISCPEEERFKIDSKNCVPIATLWTSTECSTEEDGSLKHKVTLEWPELNRNEEVAHVEEVGTQASTGSARRDYRGAKYRADRYERLYRSWSFTATRHANRVLQLEKALGLLDG